MGKRILAIAMLCLASLARAGGSVEHLFSDEALLGDWRHDVYAVRVLAVEDDGATNASPPRVRLLVLESLRGEAEEGSEIDAVWSPMPSGIDWSGDEARALIEEWGSRPLKGPEEGEGYIVLSLDPVGRLSRLRVSARCRYRDTEATRRHVRRLIDADWEGRRRASAERTRKVREMAEEAARRDRTRQADADVRGLAGNAADVAVGRWTAMIPFDGGWLLEFFDARSLKRPEVALDPDDGSGTIYVWTDRDLTEIYPVRRLQGRLLVFLEPWPEAGGRVRNAHRLVGGELGVLEATPERLSKIAD